MSDQNKESQNPSASDIGNALFESSTDAAALPSFADLFLDKIRAIHEHFDKDKDGYLNFGELSSLQLITSGNTMDENTYVMVCKMLACHPNQGIGIEALKLTYAAEGSDIEDDYKKVFGAQANISNQKDKEQTIDNGDENVIEVGTGVVDISS